jgi:hypothetical protein
MLAGMRRSTRMVRSEEAPVLCILCTGDASDLTEHEICFALLADGETELIRF